MRRPQRNPSHEEDAVLVLTRKLGEKIVIGEDIVVTLVKIDHNQVRLGIEAPREVVVFREEIRPGREPRPTEALGSL
jgi:carbon storage regulator